MKCKKCGSINNSHNKFCAMCGHKQEKQYKKYILILGVFVIFIVVVINVISLISNHFSTFEDPFDDVDSLLVEDIEIGINEYEEVDSIINVLDNDLKNNKITLDEYMMQLAYALYDTDSLDSEYKNMDGVIKVTDLFERLEDNYSELSDETLVYIIKKYTLSDYIWDVDEETSLLPVKSEKSDLRKLDNVVLSSNHNFLIYYTTDGKNAITDGDAKKIANELENIVKKYEEKYGLKFEYTPNFDIGSDIGLSNVFTAKGKAKKLLETKNIDTKYIETAMPIFIIDTDVENTNALGYYVPPVGNFAEIMLKFYDIFDDMGTNFDNVVTTYSFPFFVASSTYDNFDEMKVILAHELFHHYQKYICGDGEYGECASGNFTMETTANVAAIVASGVNTTNTALNDHAKIYMSDVDSSIDSIGLKQYGDDGMGYGAYIFAYNYTQLVNNGNEYIFDSMKYTEPLKYLYDNANGKYEEVLLTTAEKNLTLDYDNDLLLARVNGKNHYPKKSQDISYNKIVNNINYSSMNYYYVDPNDFKEGDQIVFDANNKNLTLLLFIKDNNNYKYLYEHNLSEDFILNITEFNYYSEVSFAIVNTSITQNIKYNVNVLKDQKLEPTVIAEALNLRTLEDIVNNYSAFVCYQIEEDETFYNVSQIKVGFDKKSKLSEMYFKSTIKIKDYEKDGLAFAFSQKFVSGLLYTIEKTYTDTFKYVKIITEESSDKYSITFKITKNFYNALSNSFSIKDEDKLGIVKSLQENNFFCMYET